MTLSTVDDYIAIKLVHEIHTSERRSFRGCRRRWDWIFRQNYYPIMTAKPLEFGVAYHKGMEVYYEPSTWDWDREVVASLAIQAFVDVCEEQRTKALKAADEVALDSEVQQDYNERVELGIGMMKYYFNHVAPKEDIGWKPKHVEIAFMLPVPNPETGEDIIWCTCDTCYQKMDKHDPEFKLAKTEWKGLPVVYAGRIDMLAEDKNGNYWIFDWKTARALSTNDEFLYLDDQIGSYVWALRRLGLNIRGFVYHEQKKGYPLPPKENQNIRLGRKFSVAKNQDTSFDFYLKTVMEEDTKAWEDGLYDDMLEYLRTEAGMFHSRKQIAKSDNEIDSIERDIGLEALDMVDPKVRIYPSAGRFGCTFCAFRQPCMEKNDKGDFQYALDTLFERREHYYVRQEASTESKGGE